jgi:ATP-binding cassette subfamily B protein
VPVLNRVSIDVHPGETVALVGRSGAGKSTLVSLLGRFHEPASGRVLIDGTDVRRFKIRALREQIATVPQESVVFEGSVGENIQYGRLDATAHEVMLAARAAHCENLADGTLQGLDAPLGNGNRVSGGERQRVSIARAFLKDAPILVLDEPTAALDTLAERTIVRALTELRQGRTTFVIAHRLSTVKDADRILVLDAGTVVAQGTHDALLGTSPVYRELAAELLDEVEPSADPPAARYH